MAGLSLSHRVSYNFKQAHEDWTDVDVHDVLLGNELDGTLQRFAFSNSPGFCHCGLVGGEMRQVEK